MNANLAQRAIAGLYDYYFYLQEGRKLRGHRKKSVHQQDENSALYRFLNGPVSLRSTDRWWKSKEDEWSACGRVRADGTLKLTGSARPAWTLEALSRVWPQLQGWDALAVLVYLDGEIEEGYMDTENIRAVLEEIVDLRIQQIFGQVLVEARRGPDPALGALTEQGRKNRETMAKNAAKVGGADGRGKGPRRVRHPKTGELVTKEERNAYLAEQAA